MFPRDAITVIITLTTPQTVTVLSASTTPYTLLSVAFMDLSNGEQVVRVGGNNIATKGTSGTGVVGQNFLQYAFTNQAVTFTKANSGTTTMQLVYVPRNRTITADPTTDLATSTPVSNFPTSFNIGNWQLATSTTVLNWSSTTLNGLNVLCTNCSTITGTSSGSSTIIINGGYNGMNFQEMMVVCSVIIAILSISVWRFVFRSTIKL